MNCSKLDINEVRELAREKDASTAGVRRIVEVTSALARPESPDFMSDARFFAKVTLLCKIESKVRTAVGVLYAHIVMPPAASIGSMLSVCRRSVRPLFANSYFALTRYFCIEWEGF